MLPTFTPNLQLHDHLGSRMEGAWDAYKAVEALGDSHFAERAAWFVWHQLAGAREALWGARFPHLFHPDGSLRRSAA